MSSEPAVEIRGLRKRFGDPGNRRYSVAAIFLYSDLDAHVRALSNARPAAEMVETLTGQGSTITEFDAAVPGLVVFALLNALLTAGAAFLREVDRGTMVRLALSRLRAWEFVGAITIVQALICVAAMMLALAAALAVGFPFRGSYLAMTVLAVASSVGVVGVALLTAAFLKTVHDLLTVGVAPYFVIMFFSGLMFPTPRTVLLRLGDHTVRHLDLLPLASSVTAFDRVMNYGTGLGSLGFDLALVGVGSLAWFAAGLWAYRRRHMRLS
jgi:ABC-2 type transport system permease protein